MKRVRDRRYIAGLALFTAALTGAGAAAIGGTTAHGLAGLAYLVVAMVALLVPGALVVQVVGGQMLAGGVLLAPDPPSLLVLLPLIAGVVATAELLALAARMETPFPRDALGGLYRAGAAALIAGAVYAVTAAAGLLSAPSGLIAVALASAASAALALAIAAER